MIQRVSVQEIRAFTSEPVTRITDLDRDEMAIPSYLHRNPLIRWLMWRRYEEIARVGHFTKETKVLEFGCGSGVFLPELVHSCGQVYALDLFPEYAKNLANMLELKVEFLNELAELQDASVDLIIAADVLEHITDLGPYLKLFAAKLKADGRLIVSGPTENFAYKIGRFLAGFGDKGDYHHTNIDLLMGQIIDQGFRLNTHRNLPFPIPPQLFRVCEFSTPYNANNGSI